MTTETDIEVSHHDFAALMESAKMWEDDLYGDWNIPVWIDPPNEDRPGIVEVGVVQPRREQYLVFSAPATKEQVHELRCLLMRVWAGRAEAGFNRTTGKVGRELQERGYYEC